MAGFQGIVDVALAGSADDGNVWLLLKGAGGFFDERWFVAPQGSIRKEILATALAAITAGQKVFVDIQDPTENKPINSMYLTHHPSSLT